MVDLCYLVPGPKHLFQVSADSSFLYHWSLSMGRLRRWRGVVTPLFGCVAYMQWALSGHQLVSMALVRTVALPWLWSPGDESHHHLPLLPVNFVAGQNRMGWIAAAFIPLVLELHQSSSSGWSYANKPVSSESHTECRATASPHLFYICAPRSEILQFKASLV